MKRTNNTVPLVLKKTGTCLQISVLFRNLFIFYRCFMRADRHGEGNSNILQLRGELSEIISATLNCHFRAVIQRALH
jgi:hypothetical protein